MERIILNTDWVFYVMLCCMVLISFSKYFNESKFFDLLTVLSSKKFFVTAHREDTLIINRFNVLLFINQLLVFSLLVYLLGYTVVKADAETDFLLFIKILLVFGLFIFVKFGLDTLLGYIFKISQFVIEFNLVKLTYRNFLGLLLIPFVFFLYVSMPLSLTDAIIIGAIIITINGYAFFRAFFNFRKFVQPHLFYFILYLCALEIAPYAILIKWFF
ncbi:MAG: DUF4271 domain-containing protein [Flavobacteriaceae bacterium]|nr:DUF4271 domain-containing protein [Flavobacteriaceae bacterium]